MRRALALGVGLALAAGLAVLAQPADNSTSGGSASSASSGGSTSPPPPGPPGVPVLQAPPEPTSPSVNAPPSDQEDHASAAPSNAARETAAAAKPPPPAPAAPKPVRSSTAVLQALDKVTTETMRFAAPVGQPIRYKNLVFTVKACETSGVGSASPQSSAYVVIDLAPQAAQGGIAPPPPHQVFKGWMFANSPGLNPFQHPIYDAWLIACTTTPPPA